VERERGGANEGEERRGGEVQQSDERFLWGGPAKGNDTESEYNTQTPGIATTPPEGKKRHARKEENGDERKETLSPSVVHLPRVDLDPPPFEVVDDFFRQLSRDAVGREHR
jgi:hypothetical protein